MNCQYCNKTFSSLSNLNFHIKTAKYCLKIRNNSEIIQNNDKLIEEFKCDYCDDIFFRKYILNKHIKICKEKKQIVDNKLTEKNINFENEINLIKNQYENQINTLKNQSDDYKTQIKDLTDRLERLCNKAIEKPTTTNVNNNKNNKINSDNNKNNKILNNLGVLELDMQKVEEVFMNQLNFQHVINGQKGVAEVFYKFFLVDHNNQPLAICTDKARGTIQYKNENGEIVKDYKAYNIGNKIAPIAEKAAEKTLEDFRDYIHTGKYAYKPNLKSEPKDRKSLPFKQQSKFEKRLAEKMNLKINEDTSNIYFETKEKEYEYKFRLKNIKNKYFNEPKKTKEVKKITKFYGIKQDEDNNIEFDYSDCYEKEDLVEETDYSDYITEDANELYEKNEKDFQDYVKCQKEIERWNDQQLKNKELYDEGRSWCEPRKDHTLSQTIEGKKVVCNMINNNDKFGNDITKRVPVSIE